MDVHHFEVGHTFKFSCFLHFLLLTAHTFFVPNGLKDLLDKLEFSKGTENIKALGTRVSFIVAKASKLD